MRKSSKLFSAVAFGGLVAAGGTAFTSSGVTNNAPASQFLGGTISQTITGATLDSIVYGFTGAAHTAIHTVTLTFDDTNTDGLTPTIAFTGTTAGTFVCEAVSHTTSKVSTCTASTDAVGATALAVTVPNSP